MKIKKAIGILISPSGEEWFDAYGPMTKDKSQATLFVSPEIANRSAMNRFGRGRIGFWDCETSYEASARKQYKGWSNRTEIVEVNVI